MLTRHAIGTSGTVKLAKKEAKPAAAPKAAAPKVRYTYSTMDCTLLTSHRRRLRRPNQRLRLQLQRRPLPRRLLPRPKLLQQRRLRRRRPRRRPRPTLPNQELRRLQQRRHQLMYVLRTLHDLSLADCPCCRLLLSLTYPRSSRRLRQAVSPRPRLPTRK
jgi:hypothetical protein